MKYIYFTKSLKEMDAKALVAYCKKVGLQGVDLAVRPGYTVEPANAATKLPELAKVFRAEGLDVPLVTAPTSLIDPNSVEAKNLFNACSQAGVAMVKIGYFSYKGKYSDELIRARKALEGFEKLSESTRVKACYHTHSGTNLGNNAVSLKDLLLDRNPHHIGAFADTGHLALNGGPIRMELEILKPWLSILAIKDIVWSKKESGWAYNVAPAGTGIVKWMDAGKGVADVGFQGTIVLHGEYEAADISERTTLAVEELRFLKKVFG